MKSELFYYLTEKVQVDLVNKDIENRIMTPYYINY